MTVKRKKLLPWPQVNSAASVRLAKNLLKRVCLVNSSLPSPKQRMTVTKSGIVDTVLNWAKFKQDQMLKKTDGHKRSRYVKSLLPKTCTDVCAELRESPN